MVRLTHRLLAMILVCLAKPAVADPVTLPQVSNAAGKQVASQASVIINTDGSALSPASPLPIAPKQESFQLIAANTPAAARTIYGGTYVFAQTCSSYGTVTLRGRGPDGTMYAIADGARTAAGSALYTFGSGAEVDATVAGTAGCVATLSRVPQ